jgi:branched-chain amino acid transport system substrate-binding protein
MTSNTSVRRRIRIAVLLAAGSLLVAACDAGDAATTTPVPTTASSPGASDPPPSTEAPPETDASPETEAPDDTDPPDTDASSSTEPSASEPWTVDTEACADADAANAPIEGTVEIGSVMPLSGGVAAAAFAPIADGFRAYIDHANEEGLLEGLELELSIEDDQYREDLTLAAVTTLIDAGIDLFSGIIGAPNNMAVRDLLNDDCIPQLNALNVLTGSSEWGDVADHPWTTGLLVPYTVEAKVYAAQLRELHPGGATVALFYVDSDLGHLYADAFRDVADDFGLEIVEEQTVDAADTNPPISQVANIASAAPDAIVAVPLGAGCITFLAELGAAIASAGDWTPDTFITSTCANSRILAAAGAAADGVYTSANLRDPSDPAEADQPGVREFVEYMTSIDRQDIIATAGVGWTTGEVTVAIIEQAMASPDGLTRASIINAARDLTFVPSLGRDGVELRSDGEADPHLAESLQVLQYAAGTGSTPGTFTDVGDLVTEFET